jgi:hypothetical protein
VSSPWRRTKLPRGPPYLCARQHVRRRERPEQEVRAPREREHAAEGDRLVEVPELVVEVERADLPEQGVAGGAHDCHEARVLGRRDPHRDAAEEEARAREQGDAAKRAAKRIRVVAHVEGVPAQPQHDRGREAARGGLHVQALQQVEHGQSQQQPETQAQGALPAPPQVRRRHEQEHRGRDRRGMRELQRLERLDPQEQMAAPGDVGLDRGGEVDEAGERGRHRDELGQGIGAAHRTERMNAHVQPEPPGGGVPLRGEEVAPVLRHEPDAGGQRGDGPEVVVQAVSEDPDAEPDQQGGAQVPLVNTGAEHVHPGSEPVSVDPQHASARHRSAAR